MRQVDFQLIDASSCSFGETSPSNTQADHLTIGNLVFETNPQFCQSTSEEDYFNSVLSAKQNALPISCILEKKQKGIIEVNYCQKRSQFSNFKEISQQANTVCAEHQYSIQKYLSLSQDHKYQNENNISDSDSSSGRAGYQACLELELKESAFAYFIEKELGSFSNNTGVNGKSQIFSYTIIQCVEDELEPFILRKGFSESLITIIGSNRNHFQQMMMRISTYEPRSQEIRRQQNNQLLQTHLQCFETSKIASQDVFSQQSSSSQQNKYPDILPTQPLVNYYQSQIETLEKIILNCTINTTAVPCILNGVLLGFIQFEFYAFQAPIVKKLIADRRVDKMQIPNFWNEQEYNIKSELFLQRMECYNNTN
ncbi:hypothetical protein ABPG72_014716 [Tetrahymena utriculariae]